MNKPKALMLDSAHKEQLETLVRSGMTPVIIKTTSGGEFAEQILAELIAEGLSGEALLSKFKAKQAQIRPAVEAMLSDAEDVAEGKGDFETYDDVFGTED